MVSKIHKFIEILQSEIGILEGYKSMRKIQQMAILFMNVVAQIIGGAVVQRFGARKVLGLAQFLAALASLCIPLANVHDSILISVRCLEGFASGFIWPAIFSLMGPWVRV